MTTPTSNPEETVSPHQQPETTSTTAASVDDPSHPLHHHRRMVTDFDYGEAIGEGSYSTVLVARDKKTDKQYAVKKLDKAHIVKNDKVKYVMSERDALSRMNHPGIVKLYWTFRDNRSLYYVLDLAPHGELYTFIQKMAPLDIDTTRYYASQILVALDHIHSKEVVHRDLKPENILLDDQMHIKIADFGSAKILSEDNVAHVSGTRSFVGTAEFVSPELLLSNPTHKEADWWAFGCVIFQMLSGRSPFKAATDYLIFQKIKNLDYEFPEDFPQVAMDLVQRLLVTDSEKRLGSKAMGGVDSIKAHPFFQGVDFDQAFQQAAPTIAHHYMEDLKRQQAEQRSKRATNDDFDSDDDFGFGTWLNGQQQQGNDFYIIPTSFADDSGPSPIAGVETGTPCQHNAEPHSLTSFMPPKLSSSAQESPINPGTQVSPSSPVSDASSTQLSPVIPSNNAQSQGPCEQSSRIVYLYPNESIVHAGSVSQRRGLFTKKRYLILTDKPRLLYLDEGREPDGSGGKLRNEIDWTPKLSPELKGSTAFSITTAEKSYTFDVTKDQAEAWINAINTKLVDSFGIRSA